MTAHYLQGLWDDEQEPLSSRSFHPGTRLNKAKREFYLYVLPDTRGLQTLFLSSRASALDGAGIPMRQTSYTTGISGSYPRGYSTPTTWRDLPTAHRNSQYVLCSRWRNSAGLLPPNCRKPQPRQAAQAQRNGAVKNAGITTVQTALIEVTRLAAKSVETEDPASHRYSTSARPRGPG